MNVGSGKALKVCEQNNGLNTGFCRLQGTVTRGETGEGGVERGP